tara:strand:+ start:1764 stop:2384 length:621 start_codon:yes stop_codon:yes gene_type:complete
MKVSNEQLRQIIKEELQAVINELMDSEQEQEKPLVYSTSLQRASLAAAKHVGIDGKKFADFAKKFYGPSGLDKLISNLKPLSKNLNEQENELQANEDKIMFICEMVHQGLIAGGAAWGVIASAYYNQYLMFVGFFAGGIAGYISALLFTAIIYHSYKFDQNYHNPENYLKSIKKDEPNLVKGLDKISQDVEKKIAIEKSKPKKRRI